MPSFTDPIVTLQRQVRQLLATVASFQGRPADTTLSVPHNDSWIFEDNVDATHAANLRYIISKNVTRVVSARLSIFMAPYRTYNNFSATTTGGESIGHTHGTESGHSHSHAHNLPLAGATYANPVTATGLGAMGDGTVGGENVPVTTDATGSSGHLHGSNTPGHTHLISVTSTLGVTEGATATGVTVAFDGVDATAALGGPFNADVIELDVRRFIQIATGVKHTIAMQPSGLGRIEAHLRLGVYVSAGQIL